MKVVNGARDFKVVDFHVHFPFRRWPGPDNPILKAYAQQRQQKMRKEWDLPLETELVENDVDELEAAKRWADEVTKYHLERVVFVTGPSHDKLSEIVRQYPDKFTGFAFNDPTGPNALDEFRRAIEELGLSGYKLIGPRLEVPFEDESLAPLWKYIASKRLPVLIHFGLLGKAGGVVYHPRINPLTLFPVASKYPEIPFIVPHFGCGYWQELLQLCWSCPNIYVDTSGSNEWIRWMPYPLSLEDLFRKAYETIGPERIVFGTDSSWFPRGFAYSYLQEQLKVCYYIGMKDQDIKMIFRDNALRLLGLQSP